jgi:hypothetical protein
MTLVASLRLIALTLFILILGVAIIVFPAGKEISITQFADSNLIGYVQIKTNPENPAVRALLQTKFNEFWNKQNDSLTKIPKPILRMMQNLQHQAMTRIIPYYGGVLLFQSDISVNPIPLYLINARIHPALFKFGAILISIFDSDFRKADRLLTKEINRHSAMIYQHEKYLFSFERNLCFISDNVSAFKYIDALRPKPFAANISMMQSLLNPKSDILVILDNRFKTYQLAQNFFKPRKFSLFTVLADEFYEAIRQRLKIYSDSIIVAGIEADFIDEDRVKGNWLIVMKDSTSAKKFAMVIDALHQLISHELASRNLCYRVERNISDNQIISDFEITGLRQLVQKN